MHTVRIFRGSCGDWPDLRLAVHNFSTIKFCKFFKFNIEIISKCFLSQVSFKTNGNGKIPCDDDRTGIDENDGNHYCTHCCGNLFEIMMGAGGRAAAAAARGPTHQVLKLRQLCVNM